MVTDLVRRLQRVAAEAIANERPGLEPRPETIRGVTVEITPGRAGGPVDAVVSIERWTQVAELGLLDHAAVRMG